MDAINTDAIGGDYSIALMIARSHDSSVLVNGVWAC